MIPGMPLLHFGMDDLDESCGFFAAAGSPNAVLSYSYY